MRVKDSKFLNTTPKIFGIKLNELVISLVLFFILSMTVANDLVAFIFVILNLVLMMILRSYPSLHFFHKLFSDDLIKNSKQISEVNCE